MSRHIKLDGVDNLRDFGGYATACGRGLKPGRLYRSGHHHRATDADLEALGALGLKTIVDLRRTSEREREPNRTWSGFGAEVIDNDIPDSAESGWEERLRGQDPTVGLFRDMSREWYRRGPFEPRIVDLYRRYFQVLAETGGPILVHCAAGKDRTGLVVALTQHLAGVDRADILDDYLMTNELCLYETRLRAIGERIARICARAPTEEAVRAALGVEAEDLEAAIAAILERHGSMDNYLETVLGVDRSTRVALEAHLLG